MGCNIPRPWKRPPTPPISDQPYGSKTNEAVLKAFEQFHEVAHDLTYHETVTDPITKEHRTNCPNCCATITGPICEYCGTRFPELQQHYQILRTTENQEIIIPIYISGEQIDKVVKRNSTPFRSGNPAADVVAPPLPVKKQR